MNMLNMMREGAKAPSFPHRSGVSLKPPYYEHILSTLPEVGFFEIHAENYLSDGGPNRYYLDKIREHYPITIHGVGLSIGGENALDIHHLEKVAQFVDRIIPLHFSEHLAWSSHEGIYFNDLLPLPYTKETLDRVCRHIEQVQERLKRPILLENPATYLQFNDSHYNETEFIEQVAKRTGCGLLLDINNVAVSCFNRQSDPIAYLEAFPKQWIKQIHLAGFRLDQHSDPALRIDSHDCEVHHEVWDLYQHLLSSCGDVMTLIEWDGKLPSFETLHAQARLADKLRQCAQASSQ